MKTGKAAAVPVKQRTAAAFVFSQNLFSVCELVLLHRTDNVHDGAVAGLDDADHAVAELDLIRSSDDSVSNVAELFDGLDRKACVLGSFDQIRPLRVDGDAVVRAMLTTLSPFLKWLWKPRGIPSLMPHFHIVPS